MDDVIVELVEKLRVRGQTMAFAESCTGGLVSSEVTRLAGVSDIYLGGVVAYCNKMKMTVLNVPAHLLSTVGAVSRPVALSMAHGVKALTKATWTVSITGIAGPNGGTDRKPVGTVCFAIAGPGFEQTTQKSFSGSRTEVQKSSAEFAVRWLLEYL